MTGTPCETKQAKYRFNLRQLLVFVFVAGLLAWGAASYWRGRQNHYSDGFIDGVVGALDELEYGQMGGRCTPRPDYDSGFSDGYQLLHNGIQSRPDSFQTYPRTAAIRFLEQSPELDGRIIDMLRKRWDAELYRETYGDSTVLSRRRVP